MRTIKIYQTSIDTAYAFMNWEFAEKKGFNVIDYKLVAEYTCNEDRDDNDVLNNIWNIGNDGTLQKIFNMRSISVSDIIEINGTKYYVDTWGFKKIK